MFNYSRDPECKVCKDLEADDEHVVLQSELWRVSLAPDQRYLARAYFTPLDHLPDVPSLGEARWLDFYQLRCDYERMVKGAFKATYLTDEAHMHDGYKSDIPHPHYHVKVRPRYHDWVHVGGETFTDELFATYHSREPRLVSEDVMRQISVALEEVK